MMVQDLTPYCAAPARWRRYQFGGLALADAVALVVVGDVAVDARTEADVSIEAAHLAQARGVAVGENSVQQLKAPSTEHAAEPLVPSGALENLSGVQLHRHLRAARSGAGCTRQAPRPPSGGCCAAGPGRWRQPRPGKVAGIEVGGLRRRQGQLDGYAAPASPAAEEPAPLSSEKPCILGSVSGIQAASNPRPPARQTGRLGLQRGRAERLRPALAWRLDLEELGRGWPAGLALPARRVSGRPEGGQGADGRDPVPRT